MTELKSRRQAPTLIILIMGRENYREASGTSPDFGAGKTEVFSGKVFSGKFTNIINKTAFSASNVSVWKIF
jgi:hypothetical protein